MNPPPTLRTLPMPFQIPLNLPMCFFPVFSQSCLPLRNKFCVTHFLSLKIINMMHTKTVHYLVLVLSCVKHLATCWHQLGFARGIRTHMSDIELGIYRRSQNLGNYRTKYAVSIGLFFVCLFCSPQFEVSQDWVCK